MAEPWTYYERCPFCGEAHEQRTRLNIICGCGAKYYFQDNVWIDRKTGLQRSGGTMAELKPCPFCGCEMQLEQVEMADGKTIRFDPRGHHKRGCQLQFVVYIGGATTVKGAIKKWNRRESGA